MAVTVKLSPLFNDQTLTASGVFASGYKLFTYAAGSSTNQATYTDNTGTSAQTNPIILNASGCPASSIWLAAGQAYKFVLALPTDTDPPASPVKVIDNVSGINDSSQTASQWLSSGVTPTYINATTFTLVGDQTTDFHVGRRLQFTVTAGTVYGQIVTSVYATLTTVTVLLDSGTLDSGLSAINLSILRNDHLAAPSGIARSGANTDITSLVLTGLLTTNGQIVFPATQNPSSNANTLDDYEEGTWTPVVTAGTGTLTTVSGSGTYTKIGRVVHISLSITITNVGTAGQSINSSLPFSVVNVGHAPGREATAGVQLLALLSGVSCIIFNNSGNFPGGNGLNLQVSGIYTA